MLYVKNIKNLRGPFHQGFRMLPLQLQESFPSTPHYFLVRRWLSLLLTHKNEKDCSLQTTPACSSKDSIPIPRKTFKDVSCTCQTKIPHQKLPQALHPHAIRKVLPVVGRQVQCRLRQNQLLSHRFLGSKPLRMK